MSTKIADVVAPQIRDTQDDTFLLNTLQNADVLELFKIFRDYLKHEGQLLNWRVTYFTATQAFFFGAYAFFAQDKIKNGKLVFVQSGNELIERLRAVDPTFFVVLAISIFGIVAARKSLGSIRAALLAIHTLKEKWHRLTLDGSLHPELPELTGGGSKDAYAVGHSSATFLPHMAISGWVLIAISPLSRAVIARSLHLGCRHATRTN